MDASAALRRVDLNLLLPLQALLTHRHVTRAADELGIGQSSMSANLARLRRLFDDPLLVRSGRVLELTPLGQALVEPLRAALVGVEQLLSTSPHFDPAVDQRRFTVVASDYVTMVLLRPLIQQLYREAPGVVLDTIAVNGTTALALERAQVDLVIMPRELTLYGMGSFPRRTLWTDRYVAAVWNQNREVGAVLDREAMERLPYVRYNGMGGDSFIDIQLTARGITPRTTLATQNFTLVPSLLPGTSLFGFVHERLVLASHLRRELRILDTGIEFSPISETMYWHPVFHQDAAHHWLRERVSTLAANL